MSASSIPRTHRVYRQRIAEQRFLKAMTPTWTSGEALTYYEAPMSARAAELRSEWTAAYDRLLKLSERWAPPGSLEQALCQDCGRPLEFQWRGNEPVSRGCGCY